MIKPSDISVTVTKDSKSHNGDTIVRADLTIFEVAVVYRGLAIREDLIENTKGMVRHAVYQKMYGELRDSIEEMYVISMVNMQSGPQLEEVRALKTRIDNLMGENV